jgi:hypothetical protein
MLLMLLMLLPNDGNERPKTELRREGSRRGRDRDRDRADVLDVTVVVVSTG